MRDWIIGHWGVIQHLALLPFPEGSNPLIIGLFLLAPNPKRHLYWSHHLGNYKDFRNQVPETRRKTKYILLIINHHVTGMVPWLSLGELLSPTLLLHRAFSDPCAGLREGHRAHSEPLKANGNLRSIMEMRISALPVGPETRNAGTATVTPHERWKPVRQRQIPEM